MPDEPQNSNANRISAMLQDLAAQKSGSTPPPAIAAVPSRPPAPMPSAPVAPSANAAPRLSPPANLPTAPARVAPVSPVTGIAPPPRPSAPPPAPREPTISVVPIPVPPPPPAAPKAPVVPPPITPRKPVAAEVSTELRTMSADIGSLRVGQSPQGIRPPALVGQRPAVPATAPIVPQRPVVPATPQPMVIQTAPPAVIVLPESGSGSGRKIIYAILGVLVLGVIIFSLISLFGGSTSEPETAASTTPSPSAEPSSAAASGKTLRTYYGNPTANIDMSERANAINDFRNGFISIQPTAKLATVVGVNSKGSSLTSTAFLDYLLGTTPSSLTAVLGSDWTLLVYGQTEQFDDSGAKTVLSTPKAKTILLIEVSNASGANQSLKEWEQTGLASASAGLLGYDTSKKIVSGFGDGEYRTIPVRYWNFPYADSSMDYAIITASNNKNYLILSASREAMFFAIDQLMQ